MNKVLDPKQIPVFEPKKENRFIVTFGAPFEIPKWVTRFAPKPALTNLNRGITWKDMTFLLYDPVTPSTSEAIIKGLRKLKKQDCQDVDIRIELLDPVGNIVERWEIKGEISTINFGTLNWNSDELLTIEMTFKVKDVVLDF